MKVALTVWENRISPVFDVSREVLIVDVEGSEVIAREHCIIAERSPLEKISRLLKKGTELLICGAISDALYRELQFHGIGVNSFVGGSVDEVLTAFLEGKLYGERFLMPGCAHRSKRLRRQRKPMI